MSAPYYNPQQFAAAQPHSLPVQAPILVGDEFLWAQATTMPFPSGYQVQGTYEYLYNTFPELRRDILDTFDAFRAFPPPPADSDQMQGLDGLDPNFDWGAYLAGPSSNQEGSDEPATEAVGNAVATANTSFQGMNTKVEGPGRLVASAEGLGTAGGQQNHRTPAFFNTDLPVPESARDRFARLISGAHPSPPAASPSAHSGASKRSPAPAKSPSPEPPRNPIAHIPYIEDVANADAARTLFAHPLIRECTKLDIKNDDHEEVNLNIQDFAKQFFDAVLIPGIRSYPGLEDINKKKFRNQQDAAMRKIKELLNNPTKQQFARARCVLAVDAAIFVSENGIPSELYHKALTKPDAKSDRYAHADLKSKCSERLANMTRVVRDYKQVAVDLLKHGKDLHKLAYDADWVADEKVVYLKSNVQRQGKLELVDSKKGTGEKRGRDIEDDEDYVGGSAAKQPRIQGPSVVTGWRPYVPN
jgi:hypothetical protein